MNHRLLHAVGVVALASGCSQSSTDGTTSSSSSQGAGPSGATGSGGSGSSTHAATSTTGSLASGTGGAGGSTDPCANSFFCDDFEGYTAGAAPGGKWGKNESGGSIAVDTTHAHSGLNAVRAAADASGGYRSVMISLSDPSLLPVAGNVIYGRMMFYLDSSPTNTVHWTFIDAMGATNQGYDAIYRYGGQIPLKNGNGDFIGNQLMANYDTPNSYQSPPVGPSSDCWLHANTEVVPVGAWSCAEWEFDGPNNTMHFWLDGAPLADLTMNGTGQGCVHQPASFTWLAPQFDRVDLGWESYQADDARNLWIDDVALGTQRLGCPK